MALADVAPWVVLALVALGASTLAAVAGFGGAVVLLPVLVWVFGVRDAVPILTVIQIVGNLSRVAFNRRLLVWPVVGWFALGAVPSSVLGALLFVAVPTSILTRLLGAFLLASVAYRHTALGRKLRVSQRGFLGVGSLLGFLSALLGSVGPLAAPFFLSYGLVGGAYIGTEALTAVVMHVVKLGVYGGYALVSGTSMVIGLAIGAVMILGSYLGKRLLERVPPHVFPWLIEAVLIVSGVQLLVVGG
jgi:uncharacterized membrane protein YfcA